jgi:hypothetical protein
MLKPCFVAKPATWSVTATLCSVNRDNRPVSLTMDVCFYLTKILRDLATLW